jgi:hypothetical protein
LKALTPNQFLKETTSFVRQIEIIIELYDASTTKVERIHKVTQLFKEVINAGIQE